MNLKIKLKKLSLYLPLFALIACGQVRSDFLVEPNRSSQEKLEKIASRGYGSVEPVEKIITETFTVFEKESELLTAIGYPMCSSQDLI
ncbi:hypothetical protein [Cardinium endosymbiont of Nabis limbatus]|uniref:hypothetical protein n=1 Tax=Cardinium endosymbiont of Nabis limbatus TaxID=3066217 RepID=UPI003AF3DAFE